MFKVGDKVKIISNGKIYSHYKEFAIKYGYPDSVVPLGSSELKTLPNNTRGKILAIGKHLEWRDDILCILQCFDENDTQIIISYKGIELVCSNINKRINN